MKVSRDSYALLQGGFVMTVELLKQATKRVVGNKQTAKAIQKGTAKTARPWPHTWRSTQR